MAKRLQNLKAGLTVAALTVAGATALAGPVSAQTAQQGADIARPNDTPGDLEAVLSNIVDVLLFVIGIISVIMLIVGGIRYTLSNGKQDQITAAKTTITYAIVGLVIAFLAYAIVHWVIGNLAE